MASKRLSNALKDAIRKNIIAFIEKKHSIVKEVYNEFAMAVWYEFHGQYEDTLKNLPEGTYYHTAKLGVYVNEDDSKYNSCLTVTLPKTCKCFVYNQTPTITREDHQSIINLYLRYKTLNQTMVNEQKQAASAFNSIANGCNTLRQLQDAWPDVVAYLPSDAEGAKPLALPMDTKAVETLNALLGR